MQNRNIYLFDLGGVIFHLNYQKTYKAFEQILGMTHQQFFNQFHQPAFFDQHERGEISDESFLQNFKDLNPHLNHQEIINAWNAMLIGIPEENLDFMQQLSQNADLYLLSNTNNLHWEKVQELLDEKNQTKRFNNCFKNVFLSFELGMRKPEARIYQHCLSKIGVDAQDITFIDDNYHNIAQAKNCGINAKLYPPNNPLLTEDFLKLALLN